MKELRITVDNLQVGESCSSLIDAPWLLVSQVEARDSTSQWKRTVYQNISSRLSGTSGFPCVFSKNAYKKELIKFLFVDEGGVAGARHIARGLIEYTELSRVWDGSINTSYPLLIAFSKEVIRAKTVEEYQRFGWKILQDLHELDPVAWPTNVAKDPQSPDWSMCFNGMPIFCNMSCPAHINRKSRNLGEHFIIVVNPRERFDVFAGDTPSGRKARANIRSRINDYDALEHCPQLGSYGTGSIEWWQYGILDENRTRTDTCPFQPKTKK